MQVAGIPCDLRLSPETRPVAEDEVRRYLANVILSTEDCFNNIGWNLGKILVFMYAVYSTTKISKEIFPKRLTKVFKVPDSWGGLHSCCNCSLRDQFWSHELARKGRIHLNVQES